MLIECLVFGEEYYDDWKENWFVVVVKDVLVGCCMCVDGFRCGI